jgi:hypothetical protein
MLHYQHTRCRRSCLILLFAGLLYLAGAAVESVLHVYAAEGKSAVVVLVDGETEGRGHSTPSVPHDESQCMLCKVAAPIVGPEGGPVLTYYLTEMREVVLPSSRSRAPPAVLSPRPRAPPHA